jgi:uncharacterized metal-binding protein YceD (DUF177 family)
VVEVDRIPLAGADRVIEADSAERVGLADRMNLPAIAALRCAFHLSPQDGGVVLAHGHLRAEVTQTCVVSAEDFPASVEEHFVVRFVPAGTETEDDDPDSIDEIPYEGHTIDLGEAAAEQLGLALDPYPRMPGAELPEAAVEEPDHPFAALARRRSG